MMMNNKIVLLGFFLLFSLTVFAKTYYVSPQGDNSNSGTTEQEAFQLIQYAIDQMKSGDTLVVLDGIYGESLKLKSGITIKSKNPRKAIISGLNQLEPKFKKHSENIYKTRINGEVLQLFYNKEPMTWAQWPNLQWRENWDTNKKWASATEGTGPGVLTSDAFGVIKDLDLKGGYCFIRYGKGNSCYSRAIESFDGATLYWNDDNFYNQKHTGEDGRRGSVEALKTLKESHNWHPNKSKFFLTGALDLLDAPGEWFVKDDMLYLYAPNGKNPNMATIEIQQNDFSIYEEKQLVNVKIKGLDFFGTSVAFENLRNQNILLEDIYFQYIGATLLFEDRIKGTASNKPISLKGDVITIEKCLFAGAQNSALKLEGSNLTVQNCVFLENNRHANFESRAVNIEASGTFKITHNTFINNCSDAISIRQKKYKSKVHPEISFNNICNAGKYNSDVSGVYMPIKSQNYTEFHHNWVHNINGNAIRLDLAGRELTVHHNVFWASKRGMNIEGYGKFNIYNNTSVHNEIADAFTRNVLNHVGVEDASLDTSFPPIEDWNIINNLAEKMDDRVGPREKKTLAAQLKKNKVHHMRPKNGVIPIADRGSIQGNLTGVNEEVFVNGNLSTLNLLPKDSSTEGGLEQSESLKVEGIYNLNNFRGAYDVNGDYWYPGSDWLPYGLQVPKTMKEAELFAKKYSSLSIVPVIEWYSTNSNKK